MADISSDSEVFASDSGRYRGAKSHRFVQEPHRGTKISNRVEKLTSSLQDTNKNLRAVDHLLSEYKVLGGQQSGVVNKLRDEVDYTTDKLREEYSRRGHDSMRSLRASDLEGPNRDRRGRRGPTSPLRNYERYPSDREYTGYPDSRRGKYSSAVRFYDDMDADEHLHTLHQSMRDLTSEQVRLEDDFQREIVRRNRDDHDHRKTLKDLAENLKKPADNTISNVDKRLQSIQDELKAEREMLRRKQDEMGQMSSELKQALQAKKTEAPAIPLSGLSISEENDLRSRLARAEADRDKVGGELNKLKRQLDQSEGGHTALLRQVEDLRLQLTKSDQEKAKLKSVLQEQDGELREHKKIRQLDEVGRSQVEVERKRLLDEVHELRQQLTKSASSIRELGEVQKEMDRSERQRTQLSDHIEVLNKEIESKEKYNGKVLSQLQSMTEKYETCERQRHQALVQLEDTLKRLRDATKEGESLTGELQEFKQRLLETEQKKTEMKAKAQETVKQWKLKCKKLERDLDRERHSGHQSMERSEQLVKELEALRTHTGISVQQLEALKHQLAEALHIRAQQDEQLRLKDIELNEVRSLKMDAEKELQDTRTVMSGVEQELQAANGKMGVMLEEKNKLEDELAGYRQRQMMAEQQMQQIHGEMKEMAASRVQISSQLADMAQERQDLHSRLSDSQQREALAREEIETLMKKLQEDKEFFQGRMETARTQMEKSKDKEAKMMHEMSHRFKRERAEYEAELQAIKMELSEERSASRLVKKQNEKLKVEADRLHVELLKANEQTTEVQKHFNDIKEDFLSKAKLTEEDLTRARDLEVQLIDSREGISRVVKDYQNVLHTLDMCIFSVLEAAALYKPEVFNALASQKTSPSDPKKWVASVTSLLTWLAKELREREQREERLKETVRETVVESERDRQFFINEISKQSEVLDLLAAERKAEISISENPVKDPFSRSNRRASKEAPPFSEMVAERDDDLNRNSHPADRDVELMLTESENLEETAKEKERIHERYARLQETVSALKEDLATAKYSSSLPCKDPGMEARTPNGIKKVQIASPPTQNTKPRNGILKSPKTPPPLKMTDEEFAEKFMPHTPTDTQYESPY